MNLKTLTILTLACFASALTAQEMPQPTAEHEWLPAEILGSDVPDEAAKAMQTMLGMITLDIAAGDSARGKT